MRILLVNNHTRHLAKLNKALVGHEVEMQLYRPGINFHTSDKDLIILSGGGGEGRELFDKHKPNHLWYEDQIKLVLSTSKPIIGICMGFEVIAGAYGATITEMPQKDVEKYEQIRTTFKGWTKFKKFSLRQFEAHDYCIKSVSSRVFDVLAESDTGIEMIRHKARPILATQFHPEFPQGTLSLPELIKHMAAAT